MMISADVLVGGSWVINPGDGDVPSRFEKEDMLSSTPRDSSSSRLRRSFSE
jgi:hypothetical protein